MKTRRVCCQGCGANLEVDETIRFVTCNYCDARLEVVAIGPLSQRVEGDSEVRTELVRERGWRYRGCGRVVSERPLRVDFGAFRCELDLEPRGGAGAGEYLSVAIDRRPEAELARTAHDPTRASCRRACRPGLQNQAIQI